MLTRLLQTLLRQLEERPDDHDLLRRIAEIYEKQGEWKLAVPYLIRIAELYARDGFFLKAVALTKSVLKRSPELVELNVTLANWHVALGLLPEARRYFDVAISGFGAAGRRDEARKVRARIDELIAKGLFQAEEPRAKA